MQVRERGKGSNKNSNDHAGDDRLTGATMVSRTVRDILRRASAGFAAIAAGMALSSGAHAQNAVSADSGDPSSSQDKQTGLSEILVTARRKAIQSADMLKKESESIIDSVNADDAGKLPDASITEVLQRVPGVTITRWGDPDHFSAQGTGIQIRGLSGVAGRVNGREVFSANGGNGLNWSDIPPELMAGVDVYKAATADLIEGGTGGQINLRTKMPFDFNSFTAQVSGNADYADFRKKTEPTVSALLSDTWDSGALGRIGVLVDLAYGKYTSRSDFMALEPYYRTLVGSADRYIPGGFDYGVTTYDRTRKGAYAAFQWQPTDNFELTQTYFESKYQQSNVEQAVFMVTKTLTVDPNGNNVFDPSGGLRQSNDLFLFDPANLGVSSGGTFSAGGDTGVAAYNSDTRDLSTSFKLSGSGGRWALRGSFQAVDSTLNSFSYDVFPTIPFATNGFGLDATGVAAITVPGSTASALRDPTQYTYQATMDHLAGNTAHMNAYNLDYDLKITDSGFLRSLQAGARYANHTETDQTSGYDWQSLGTGWNGYNPVTFAQGSPGDYSAVVFNNFFKGRVPLPGNVLLPSLAMATRADLIGDHNKYGNPLPHGIQYDPWDRADVQYKDTAVYALIRFADDKGVFGIPYRGNFGVRVVHTSQHASGFYDQAAGSYVDPATNAAYNLVHTGIPLSGGRSDTRALPSINLELVPNDEWQTRFAFNDTMDIAPVTDIQANGQLSLTTVNVAASGNAVNAFGSWNVTFGNPELRPVIAHNFDLSQEWYPKPGSALHVDAFYKRIENALIFSSISMPWTIYYDTGPATQTVNFNGFHNSPEAATVRGVEVGGHTYFDFLPGPLKGIGVDSNYTFIDSSNPGDVYYDINGLPHNDSVPLEGLSRHNFNAALLYDYRIFSARLAYSWRSEYLLSTNTNGTNGNYNYYSADTVGGAGANCQSPQVTTCQYIKIALPVWSGAYGQLDFGLTVRPSDHFYFTFQVANLGNTIVKSFQGGYPGGQYPRNWWMSDRHFNLTVGLKF
jgi:iron complex outermembrane receptor protein